MTVWAENALTVTALWPPYAIRNEVGVLMVQLIHKIQDIIDEHDCIIIAIDYPLVAIHTWQVASGCQQSWLAGTHYAQQVLNDFCCCSVYLIKVLLQVLRSKSMTWPW